MKITTSDVIKIASQVLQVNSESLDISSSIDNTPEWDSISHMSLIVSLETAFSVEFTGEEIGELISISSIYKILLSKLPN